jgi:hypothetical protein
MSTSSVSASAPGAGAGFVAKALATGGVLAGSVALVTGGDTSEDVVVEVTFDVDPILDATFTVAQTTGTGLAAALAHTVQNTETGFTITATAVPLADVLYLFTWTS